jgi:hypothetical protein
MMVGFEKVRGTLDLVASPNSLSNSGLHTTIQAGIIERSRQWPNAMYAKCSTRCSMINAGSGSGVGRSIVGGV